MMSRLLIQLSRKNAGQLNLTIINLIRETNWKIYTGMKVQMFVILKTPVGPAAVFITVIFVTLKLCWFWALFEVWLPLAVWFVGCSGGDWPPPKPVLFRRIPAKLVMRGEEDEEEDVVSDGAGSSYSLATEKHSQVIRQQNNKSVLNGKEQNEQSRNLRAWRPKARHSILINQKGFIRIWWSISHIFLRRGIVICKVRVVVSPKTRMINQKFKTLNSSFLKLWLSQTSQLPQKYLTMLVHRKEKKQNVILYKGIESYLT